MQAPDPTNAPWFRRRLIAPIGRSLGAHAHTLPDGATATRHYVVGMRLALLGAVAVSAAVAMIVVVARPDGGGRPLPVTVTVDTTRPGRALPRSFLGFSIEYNSVIPYTGPRGRPNHEFLRLMRTVGRAQGAPVALRLGGNSGDQSWWNPQGRARPPGVMIDIGPAWVDALAGAQRKLRSPVALGLNLALDDPRNAQALVRAVLDARVDVTALEIGNEPDLFPRGRTFRVGPLVIRRPQHRPADYDPQDFLSEATRYADALAPLRPLAAGGFGTDQWVEEALPLLLARVGDRLDELTAHAYALRDCNPTTPAADLRARLLRDETTRALVRTIKPYLRAGARRGLPVRVSELNSAVCGGVAGVSDVAAAALWAPDVLFALAGAGVSQVDVHTWAGSLYAPFAFAPGETDVRPLYHALRLFARAAPVGSRLLPVRLDHAGDVRGWATIDRRGTVRLLLVNRSSRGWRDVRVSSGESRRGRLFLLRGADLAARELTMADAALRPLGGEAELRLPPVSLALLVLPAGR